MGATLELVEVVDHAAAEERGAVLERGLVDDHLGPLGLGALHHTLDARLAEIVGIALHRQAVDADYWNLLTASGARGGGGIERIVIPAGHAEHLVGDEILARAVALHNRRHHVLRHICVVGQKLLGVLWQTITAVTERRVVVMRADARIESHAVDYGLRVKPLDLGIGVQFIEIAHTQREIGVGEQLHCLRLLHTHV